MSIQYLSSSFMRAVSYAGLCSILLVSPLYAGVPVNINLATSEQLAESLDGVGPAKAEAIVSYREEHGPFASADALMDVPGIGQMTLQNNLQYIRYEEEAASAPVSE